MPKPKKRVVLVENLEEEKDDELNVPSEDELAAEEQSKEWLAEFQARFSDQPVRILIEKYDETGDWALCHKYPLTSFDQEQVKEEFGPGKYRGTLFDPKGLYIKGGRVHFKFAEALKRDMPLMQKAENPLENPVVVMMLKTMEQSQVQMLELCKSMMAARPAEASKSAGLGEIVEVMKSLKTMTPTEQKPLDNFKETLGLMKLVKEVTNDSDGESKGGILSDVKEFLDVWPAIKDKLNEIKPPLPANAVMAGPAPQPTQVQIGEKQMLDPLSQKIVALVPKFVEAGKAAAPVPEWGAYLLEVFDTDIVPLLLPALQKEYKALVKDEDDVYDIVVRLAKDPDEKEKVFRMIPTLRPHKEWCNRVIDEAVRLAETEGDESPSPEGGGESVVLEAVQTGV